MYYDENVTTRTFQDIKLALENAKLEQRDIQADFTQLISFDTNFSGTELRLLELNPEILEAIKVGTRLVFRGASDDSAVLCTSDSTFELKEAETSNSLLVIEDLSFPGISKNTFGKLASDHLDDDSSLIDDQEESTRTVENRSILRVIHSYYELKSFTPNLARLHHILLPSSYKGPSMEHQMDQSQIPKASFVTFDMLLEQVPASEGQIRAYLDTRTKYIELNGKIRLMDSDYLFLVLSQVLECIYTNSWNNNSVPRDALISQVEHSKFILDKVFSWFFCEIVNDGPGPSCRGGKMRMNEYEICRFIGLSILKSSKKLSLKDFLYAWQEAVPAGLKVSLPQLEGMAVSDKESTPPFIWYFPEENLPEIISERFIALFQAKSKWRGEEIFPYIQVFTTPNMNVGTLLTKYSRVHLNNGVKWYCAKHGK